MIYYNNVVTIWENIYWFSDINSSIYLDTVWNTDNWSKINFKIKIQDINLQTMNQKIFWWFYTSGAIWYLTSLEYKFFVDWDEVFLDFINWSDIKQIWLWEIAGNEIWNTPIWWDVGINNNLSPFDFTADTSRIYKNGIRASIEISSQSEIQDFIIDTLWIILTRTPLKELKNIF